MMKQSPKRKQKGCLVCRVGGREMDVTGPTETRSQKAAETKG
jgi:hypothetical protein